MGASWHADMADHFANNPDIIVNVFIKSGICGALDDLESDAEGEDDQFSDSSMSEESTASSDEFDD